MDPWITLGVILAAAAGVACTAKDARRTFLKLVALTGITLVAVVLTTEGRGLQPAGDKTLTARELISQHEAGLSRYQDESDAAGRLTRMTGRLRAVDNISPTGESEEVLILIDHVRGLGRNQLVKALLTNVQPETDAVLEAIGLNGRIELEGMARASPESIAALEMHEVHHINGHTVPEGSRAGP